MTTMIALTMKKGEMGMGTLLLFLAVLLIAAIASWVLITTTGFFQGEVHETGSQARSEVASMLKTVEMYGEDGSRSGIDYFFQNVKLIPGADPLRFENLLVSMQLYNVSASFTYNSSIDCTNQTTMPVGTSYGVNPLFRGDSYRVHRISEGDVAEICYRSPRSVREGESIRISLLPAVGSTSVIEMSMPDVMSLPRTPLYP